MKKIVPNLQSVAPDAHFMMFIHDRSGTLSHTPLKITGLPRNQVFGSERCSTPPSSLPGRVDHGVAAEHPHFHHGRRAHGDSEVALCGPSGDWQRPAVSVPCVGRCCWWGPTLSGGIFDSALSTPSLRGHSVRLRSSEVRATNFYAIGWLPA